MHFSTIAFTLRGQWLSSTADINLSFQRIFGTMIGRIDLVAEFTTEKYRRAIIDYAQSFFGGQLLPVGMVSSALSSH